MDAMDWYIRTYMHDISSRLLKGLKSRLYCVHDIVLIVGRPELCVM